MKYYYCENGAYHNYSCCISCWNNNPIAKKYKEGCFDTIARQLIWGEVHKKLVKECMSYGFTKKQSEFLMKGKGANFQQRIL